jgi:hypothetical protein
MIAEVTWQNLLAVFRLPCLCAELDLFVAFRKEVWHSLKVLQAQRQAMKHFIQFEAQVMPVTRPDYLRAKNGFWTPGISPRFA